MFFPLGLPATSPVVLRRVRFADAWSRALRIVDLKQDAVAMAMGMSKAALSMAVHGVSRFPYDRLIMASESDPQIGRFMDALHALIRLALGDGVMDPVETIRVALDQLDQERRRMVKASVTRMDERKSA